MGAARNETTLAYSFRELVVYHMIPRGLRRFVYPMKPYYYPLLGKEVALPEPEKSAAILYPKHIGVDDVVVEVGARVGGGTLLLSKIARYVYAFEPISFSFKMLRVHTKHRSNVSPINSAVGNRNGTIVLNLPHAPQDFPYIASAKKLSGYEYGGKTQKSKLIRLDDFRFPLQPTALVIDCEGSELEVLEGAGRMLPSVRKVLIETHALYDGSHTLGESVNFLSKSHNAFDKISSNFIDEDYQRWIVAEGTSKKVQESKELFPSNLPNLR